MLGLLSRHGRSSQQQKWFVVGCNKVQSLDGDCAHRDDAGRPPCNGTVQVKSPIIDISDDKDENLPTIDKGKHCTYENL